MKKEENSHYDGKVERYEDGRVLFRLDSKIGEFRRTIKGMKRRISLDDSDFYILSGIDVHNGKKIIIGNKYKIDRKELYNIVKGLVNKRKGEDKKGASTEEELDLSEFIKDGEISGTGIAQLLSQDDEKEEDNN